MVVARLGKLGAAARSMGVDASTMGRRMRRLEQRLGQTLLAHHRDGATLTEAGERLLASVEDMDRAARTIDDMPRDGPTLSGHLRISVAEGFGSWFLSEHLHAFCADHPDLVLELVANSGFLNPSKRETDIAITLARPRTGPVLSRRLTDYGLHLYASRDYLRSAPPVVAVADLHRHALVGYIPDLLYAPELRHLDEIDRSLRTTVQSSSINAQHRLISSRAGIGVLPDFIGSRDPALVRLLPDRTIVRSFWVVTHEENRKLRRVAAFLEWLDELLLRERAAFLGS